MRQKTHELALAGMFCALAAALLWLSGVLPLSTFFWPILASCTLLPVREGCRKSYAWSCFVCSALLGLLLCADREAALIYCFLGYYPLLKGFFDSIGSKALRLSAKAGLCAATMGTMYLLLIFVFQLDTVVREVRSTAPWLLAAACVLGLALFLVYDLLLLRVTRIYRRRAGRSRRGR